VVYALFQQNTHTHKAVNNHVDDRQGTSQEDDWLQY